MKSVTLSNKILLICLMKTLLIHKMKTVNLSNKILIICHIKVLLIYQMKTVNFTNKILLLRCQIRKWLIFNLLIYKTKTVSLWDKDFFYPIGFGTECAP